MQLFATGSMARQQTSPEEDWFGVWKIMARRNSLKKQRAHHQAILRAEAVREAAKLKRVELRKAQIATSKLAVDLERLVRVTPVERGASKNAADATMQTETGKAERQTRSARMKQDACVGGSKLRKKDRRGRRNLQRGSKGSVSEDTDMHDAATGDEEGCKNSTSSGMRLISASGHGLTPTDGHKKPGRIVKKSAAKRRREERKLKMKLLLWEGAVAQ